LLRFCFLGGAVGGEASAGVGGVCCGRGVLGGVWLGVWISGGGGVGWGGVLLVSGGGGLLCFFLVGPSSFGCVFLAVWVGVCGCGFS